MARTIIPRITPSDPRWCRAQIFFITWLAYVGFYLTRKAFAVAKIELRKEEVWGISKSTMGYIDLAYLVAYAIGQFIWGITADRVGTRRVVLTGMFVSIVTAVVAGASTITVLLGVVLFIQGLAQSTGWAPLTKNIGNFFNQREVIDERPLDIGRNLPSAGNHLVRVSIERFRDVLERLLGQARKARDAVFHLAEIGPVDIGVTCE